MHPWMKQLAWASLTSQILIVVTGAAVRLTGSGLGCPTWPTCTAESLVTVPEMGVHGVIEFANRLLTFVLAAIALAAFMAALQYRNKNSRNLVGPSLILGLGIVAQAVIGGVTVLTGLNSWIVGLHFVVSAVLIATAAVLVYRTHSPAPIAISYGAHLMFWPILLSGVFTVAFGVVVTGAGPHAGDVDTPRNGLDLEVWQHVHSYPAYLFAITLAIALIAQLRAEAGVPNSLPTKIVAATLVITVAQAILGIVQSRLGVPPFLVGLHMLGASVLCALLSGIAISFRAKVS